MLASNRQDTNNRERADIVTEQQLMHLAGKIGGTWKCLAIGYLDITNSEVDQIASSRDNQQYQIFNMLRMWRNRQNPPTIQSLIQILEEANIEYEALAYLKNECNTVTEIIATTPDPNQYEANKNIERAKVVKKVREISAEAKPPEKNQDQSASLENLQTKNLSKKKSLFPTKRCKLSKKKDATQLKSKEQSSKTKRKQRNVPVTKKHPERKQVKRRQWARKTTSAKMQAKTFEVLVLSMVKWKPKICYGCRKQLLDGEGPHLVLKTEDVREYFDRCKRKHLAFKPSNVYFHVKVKCVENKYGPFKQHKFTVPVNVQKHLNSTQFTMLKSMNIIQGADDTK